MNIRLIYVIITKAVYQIDLWDTKKMLDRFSTLLELLLFLWDRKLWWLIPMVIVFMTLGILILLIGSSPLAPIIYPLF